MENFIIKNSENYIIYRMPQIVGNNGNSNNLVNYIKNSIEKKEKIFIYEKAMRAILDVEDLKKIVDGSIEQIINEVINISFVEKVNFRNLCKKIGKILKINPIVETIEPINSVNWDIENSGIVEDVIKKIKIENKNYTYKVLTKYIKK
jgi:dTDP-4-dehydrorhamnose reductase